MPPRGHTLLCIAMRNTKFNRGAWELERERFRIERSDPPPDEKVEPVGATVPAVLKSMGLEREWRQHAVTEKWPEVVGPQIAAQTRPAFMNRGVLTVYVSHPAWLSDLQRFHRNTILERLQRALPKENIRSIRFQISPNDPTAERG